MGKLLLTAAVAAMMLFVSGCISNKEVLYPADMTVAELEKKMNEVTDPQGIFANSKSYSMKQEIKEIQWLDDDIIKMVEVKFERPDKLAIITYEDNQPVSMFCTDGRRGWIADYGSRRIVMLEEEGLKRMNMLSSLGKPGAGGYNSVFKDVELQKISNDDGNYYVIICRGEIQKEPVYFYVDAETFLLRKVKMKVELSDSESFDYENRILEYEMRDGVRIPVKTEIRQLGAVQESSVMSYQLNRKFDETEFLPPVF